MNYVVPTDRKFLTQYRNGSTFATNPTTDYVTYTQGNAVENMKLVATYEVSTISEASALIQFTITDEGSLIKITHPFNNWSAEGFVVGNAITVEANSNTVNETVSNIVGQDMYITDTGGTFIATLGIVSGDSRSDVVIFVTTVPTSLIFKFGIQPTNPGFGATTSPYNSLLDGQEQVYSVNGIGGTTTLNYLASASSDLGSVTAKFDSTAADGYTHTFTINHIFRIPHAVANWVANYQNGTIPTTFAGSSSYSYVNSLNFGVNINNPNDGKIFNDDFLIGSIGFAGQNFNAGSSVYSLETSAVFSIGASPVSNPEVTSVNVVTAQIKKNDGNFTAGVRGYLYHSRLTDSALYSNNNSTWVNNFIFEEITNTDGAAAASNLGGIISAMTVTINGGDASLLDIAFTLTYPTATQALISAGDLLLLELAVEDAAISATLSDRTVVQLNTGLSTWTKDGDVTGLITNNQLDFTEIGSVTATSNFATWINQAFELDFAFDMAKTANSDDSLLVGLKAQIVTLDTSTNNYFVNQSYEFPFDNKIGLIDIDGTGYQAFNIDTTRVLSVPSDSSLREVQLTSVVPGAYAATQAFTGKVGFIINWQEWIENNAVDTAFYNGSLPTEFFNLNRRTSNYSAVLAQYDVYFFLVATIYSSGVNTEYAMFSDKCNVRDFDVDLAGGTWTCTNSLLDNQGDVSTDIYNQTMTTKHIFAAPGAGALTIGNVMGTIVIEETNNTGRHYRLHTVLDWSEPSNPLKPETGQTNVQIVQDVPGNTITLTCSIDGTMLDPESTYNIYAHLSNNQ
jgi:hypothetical protein